MTYDDAYKRASALFPVVGNMANTDSGFITVLGKDRENKPFNETIFFGQLPEVHRRVEFLRMAVASLLVESAERKKNPE